MLTIVKLSEVNGEPVVKLDLPENRRIGDLIALKFTLRRQTGGRSEVLEVDGRFRVLAIGLDAKTVPHRQLLNVEPADKSPTWQSVKKTAHGARRLGPTRFPRTPI